MKAAMEGTFMVKMDLWLLLLKVEWVVASVAKSTTFIEFKSRELLTELSALICGKFLYKNFIGENVAQTESQANDILTNASGLGRIMGLSSRYLLSSNMSRSSEYGFISYIYLYIF